MPRTRSLFTTRTFAGTMITLMAAIAPVLANHRELSGEERAYLAAQAGLGALITMVGRVNAAGPVPVIPEKRKSRG